MAHYALLNEQNVVVRVITGKDEGGTDWEQYYTNKTGLVCKRTSYNMFGGAHKKHGTPFRKNYAAIGHTYDATRDAFIPPQPFQSWTLNEQTCLWEPPVARPDGALHRWNEEQQVWEKFG